MTRMLAGVSGPEAAAIALDAGADIIDIADPAAGPFGAAALATIRATVASVAGRAAVSAVAAGLATPDDTARAVAAIAATGVDFVRIPLPAGGAGATIAALRALAADARLIAVLPPGAGPRFELLGPLAAAGFAGAMLETADPSAPRLLDATSLPDVRRFVAECRARALLAGLAGGLEAPDVPRLLVLAPDMLGFRDALHDRGPGSAISLASVRAIRALIPSQAAPAPAGPGGSAPAAMPALGRSGDGIQTDRVFLHDLVLAMSIGAYAHERDRKQRVRFSVDVLVRRQAAPSLNMRDVFSYDIIGDGIRMLAEERHVALVETLAERIAALLLEHPRVVQASVTVEKLDLSAGIAGVTIERTRAVPPDAERDA